MDPTPLLSPDTGAIGFFAVVLWKLFEKFVLPKMPWLHTLIFPAINPPSPVTPNPAPAPTPVPAPPAPTPIPSSGRPIIDLLKRLLAAAVEEAPHVLPKLLPLLPLILEKPVEEKKEESPPPPG